MIRRFVLAALLCAWSQPARADSTEQLRKTLYVEHQMEGVIANKRYGQIALLSILNDRYNDTNGRLSRAQVQAMLAFANTRSDDLSALNDIADSALNYRLYPGERDTAKSLLRMAGTLSGEPGKKVTAILEELTDLGGRAAEHFFGPEAQREAQARRQRQIRILQRYGRETIAEALDHAVADPGFRQVLDSLFTYRGVTSAAATDTILAANSALATRRTLQTLVELAGRNDLRTEDLASAIGTIDGKIRGGLGGTDAILKTVLELRARATDAAGRQALADKMAEVEKRTDDARASLYLTQTFAGFFSRDVAVAFELVGGATIQIYESAATFAADGSSTVIFSANLVSTVIGLFGAAAQPGLTEIMLREFEKVRGDIDALRNEMRASFQQVDIKLNQLYDTMNDGLSQILRTMRNGFGDLDRRTAAIETRVRQISNQLSSLEAALAREERNVFVHLNEASRRTLEEDRVVCLDFLHDFPGARMSDEQFRTCLGKFKTWAVRNSSDTLSTGGQLRQTSTDAIKAELEAYPLENNLGYIAAVLADRFGVDHLAKYRNIGNPVVWAAAANAYVDLLSAWPDLAMAVSPDALDSTLLPIGRGFGALSHDLLVTRGEHPKVNREFFAILEGHYASASDAVVTLIEEAKAKQIVERAKGIQLDVWGDAWQRTAYQPELGQVRSCEADFVDGSGRRPTVEVRNWRDAFPTPAFLAEQLGLGKMGLCYEAVVTKNRLDLTFRGSVHLSRGAAAFSYPLFERQLTILHDGAIAITTVSQFFEQYAAQRIRDSALSPFAPGSFKRYPVAALAAEVEVALAELAVVLESELAEQLRSDTQKRAQVLDSAHALLISVLYLALPVTLESDDELHSLVYGEGGLLSGRDVIDRLVSDPSGNASWMRHFGDDLTLRRQTFHRALMRVFDVLEASPIRPQSIGVVEETLDRLETARLKMTNSPPRAYRGPVGSPKAPGL